MSQWSPAFRAGKRRTRSTSDTSRSRRNGAQLLELGKGRVGRIPGSDSSWSQWSPAFRAGKRGSVRALSAADCMSQWSPAFRAGKSGSSRANSATLPRRNGAQLLELGKVAAPSAPNAHVLSLSQWSPAFRAGKRTCAHNRKNKHNDRRNGAQLLELGKDLTHD